MTLNQFDLTLIVPALLAGALVLSTHVPLGQEVLKRGIIFIDIAIAQIAGLGVIAATVFGGELAAWQIQCFAALSAILGAALIHYLERHHPKDLEAMIGVLFVLAASGGVILVGYAANSDELLHDLLVGQILWVNSDQLLLVAGLYIPLLFIWFSSRAKRSPLLFYIVFSLVVTASVQLIGVYLVFASLILPALATQNIKHPKRRLMTAYATGVIGYILGLIASVLFDYPTGAITVWMLLLVSLFTRAFLARASAKTLVE